MNYKEDNIERILKNDIYEKKRSGRGIYARASRRGYVGSVKTQVDFLKGKEKKKYMGNSAVKISNMYADINNIPHKNELAKLPLEQAKYILKMAKKFHKSNELAKKLGYSSSGGLYALYEKYGIEVNKRAKVSKKIKEEATVESDGLKEVVTEIQEELRQEAEEKEKDAQKVTDVKEPELTKIECKANIVNGGVFAQTDGKYIPSNILTPYNQYTIQGVNNKPLDNFEIKFSGSYNKEKIENRVMNILSTLDEDSEYTITLTLTEKNK